HLDKSGTYVRLLFVDFSSAFNTIIPTLLQTKLTQLSVPSSICQWITSFLTDRHQLVKLGKFKSNSRTTSTGAPQGCVLSPLLFSLYTNDCTSTDPSIKLLKFADDTTVIGLIQDGDESAYRQEIEQLAAWCSRNNLELNTLKTVEMIVDFRRNTPALPPLTIMNSTVPTVASFRFLGTTISQDLKWDTHIDATIKKAQQRLYFLRQLRKFNLPQELLIHFYSAVIESVLCTSITVWFGSATKSDMRRLQRTVRTAERIIGAPLPTLQELYTSRKLAGLLQAEGKTLDDLRTLFPGEEPVSNPTEAILRAVTDLLDKTAKPTVGPPSIVPLQINGKPCTALLDSGSQVTIIFEPWYEKYLSDTPIQPVSGLSLWGLSESSASYPYRGYVVVDLEYPAAVFGTRQAVTLLALICPSPRAEDQTPVIVGTNASHVRRLVKQCRDNGMDVAHTLGLRVNVQEDEPAPNMVDVSIQGDKEVGQVRWQGSSPLILQPGEATQVVCQIEWKHPVEHEILMIESSPSANLPAGVFLHPMVMPSGAVEVNSFRVLVKNECLKETAIPVGAVIGCMYHTEAVTTIPPMETVSSEFDTNMINFGDSPISEQWKNRLCKKLAQKSHVFSMQEWDVGLARGVEHKIRLSDAHPFRQRSRRLAPADIEDVRKHLQELLQAGIIAESRSPYASPIVVVRKKNGTTRMCIDYRLLNSRTIPDQYTTPCIEDALNALSGSQWFSVLDLRSGYYQIAMSEEDKEKTAFICPLGFFQFERMPQGITGAPATFQRLMEKAVGDMNLLQVLVYLDDLIVFAALSTYEFDIQYRPGRHNIDADLLSRNMADMGEAEEWVTLPQSGVKTLCQPGSLPASSNSSPVYVAQLGASPHCVPNLYAFPTHLELKFLELLSRQNLKRAQEEDDAIGPAIQALTLGHWPDGKNTNPELLRLKRETGKLFKRDGLLYRFSKRSSGDEVCQLVLPSEFRDVVMQATHDDLGHLGQERTLDLLRSRFFWPKMSEDVEEYIKNCGECISYKTPPQRAAPLHQIVSHGPMDLVCMDFLSMETDSRGFSNVLVVTDHFTRYAQAFPTKSQKAHIVAKILMEGYFVHYGLPARIHTDQGRDFESRLIRELLHLMGIRKSRTTPYHPQGDPQPERFNRTLLSMLGTLDHEKKRTWSHQVSYLVHAYNSTKCDATGYSPYYLMFGHEARLPVNLCFGTSPDGIEATGHSQYVAKLKEDLKQAYKLASEAADKRHQRNKKLYDQRVKFRVLELGDRVFLRNLDLRGKHKLERSPKAVVSITPDTHVLIGESVTLRCDIQGGGDTQWTYSWKQNNNELTESRGRVYRDRTRQEFRIWSVKHSDNGTYTCRGHKSDSQSSEISDAVTLTVSAKPKATVRVNPQSSVYTGDTVTLSCELQQETGWKFHWYKNNQRLQNLKSEQVKTLNVTEDNAGDTEYKCRVIRKNNHYYYYTELSDPVKITVRVRPKPVTSINPDDQVFSGETVNTPVEEQREEAHAPQHSSDAVTLTVSERAWAVLSVSPQSWLTEGDSVTLSCEVTDSSTDWTFSWYTVVPYRDGLTGINNNRGYSVYVELLSDSSRGSGGNYTLSLLLLNTQEYICAEEREENQPFTHSTAIHSHYGSLGPSGVEAPFSVLMLICSVVTALSVSAGDLHSAAHMLQSSRKFFLL
ncbi:hypothetical protein QTP86_000879, partial [Hemibagrus guttatus]